MLSALVSILFNSQSYHMNSDVVIENPASGIVMCGKQFLLFLNSDD